MAVVAYEDGRRLWKRPGKDRDTRENHRKYAVYSDYNHAGANPPLGCQCDVLTVDFKTSA